MTPPIDINRRAVAAALALVVILGVVAATVAASRTGPLMPDWLADDSTTGEHDAAVAALLDGMLAQPAGSIARSMARDVPQKYQAAAAACEAAWASDIVSWRPIGVDPLTDWAVVAISYGPWPLEKLATSYLNISTEDGPHLVGVPTCVPSPTLFGTVEQEPSR